MQRIHLRTAMPAPDSSVFQVGIPAEVPRRKRIDLVFEAHPAYYNLTLRKWDMMSRICNAVNALGKSNRPVKTGFGAAASKLAEPQEMPPALAVSLLNLGKTPKTPHLQPKAAEGGRRRKVNYNYVKYNFILLRLCQVALYKTFPFSHP